MSDSNRFVVYDNSTGVILRVGICRPDDVDLQPKGAGEDVLTIPRTDIVIDTTHEVDLVPDPPEVVLK